MKYLSWFVCLLFATLLVGCVSARNRGGEQEVLAEPEGVELICRSANRLGCRHKGRTYPWNAWVEAKGYGSSRYFVSAVTPDGPGAIVSVVER